MAQKEYLLDFDKVIERISDKISKSPISDKNKELIFKFIREYSIEKNLAKPSVRKHLSNLLDISLMLNKDFDQCLESKTMIIELLTKLKVKKIGSKKDRVYSESTIYDFKKELKVFFKWFYNKDGLYPDSVKWIKLSKSPSKNILPETVLTKDDILNLVSYARTLRDKAMIYSLYESGTRIGEFLTLKIMHVNFDEYGCFFIVNGKTGMRRIRMVECTQYLAQWINSHPSRSNQEAPLWINIGDASCERLGYGTLMDNIKRTAINAGISKHVNPHSFRHSRATHLSKVMTEQELKALFGWTGDSGMVKRYTHLSGRDIDNKILRINGIETDTNKFEDKNKPLRCPRCQFITPPHSQFCGRCGSAMDLQIALDLEKRRNQADNLMDKLVRNPELLRQMVLTIKKDSLTEELKSIVE